METISHLYPLQLHVNSLLSSLWTACLFFLLHILSFMRGWTSQLSSGLKKMQALQYSWSVCSALPPWLPSSAVQLWVFSEIRFESNCGSLAKQSHSVPAGNISETLRNKTILFLKEHSLELLLTFISMYQFPDVVCISSSPWQSHGESLMLSDLNVLCTLSMFSLVT